MNIVSEAIKGLVTKNLTERKEILNNLKKGFQIQNATELLEEVFIKEEMMMEEDID